MDVLPWYRQPWPWFLIALPAIAVVGSVTAAVIAVRTDDGVVAADYYKRGLEINAELSRLERAAELGLTAEISAAGMGAGERVSLTLAGRRPLPADATVQLRIVHPGREDGDRVMVLALTYRSDDGREARFAGAWGDEKGDAHAPRQWIVGSSTWLVEGNGEWRTDGPVLRARAAAE